MKAINPKRRSDFQSDWCCHWVQKLTNSMSWTCLVLLLCSCSSIVKIDDTWKAKEGVSAPYQKLLIFGVTERPSLRESFEDIFADTLKRHGVAAVASHTVIKDLRDAKLAHVEDVAHQMGADGVIITRVLSHSEHTSYILSTGHAEYRVIAETETTANSSSTVAMAGAGYVPGEMDSEGAALQTNFFDASSTKPIWSAMSSTAGGSDEEIDVIWKLSALLTKALAMDNLIQITSTGFKIP